ncbi:hypothetical protein [Azospirillum griseum]|uniref:Uncharacterized protein n=1 Tax=Azospirillum griseum TaxID=2496639 RepID=A0A431V9L8_9PROT|nr:hypothetical protein [Azospirillum griseum]RTR11994.1 hypothetical protein EJ903_25815 [Azospirillum griseum]
MTNLEKSLQRWMSLIFDLGDFHFDFVFSTNNLSDFLDKISMNTRFHLRQGYFDSAFYSEQWKIYSGHSIDFLNENNAISHFCSVGERCGLSPAPWFNLSYAKSNISESKRGDFTFFSWLNEIEFYDISPSLLIDFKVIRIVLEKMKSIPYWKNVPSTATSFDILNALGDMSCEPFPVTSLYCWPKFVRLPSLEDKITTLSSICRMSLIEKPSESLSFNPYFDAAWIADQAETTYSKQIDALNDYVIRLQFSWIRPSQEIDLAYDCRCEFLSIEDTYNQGPYKIFMVKMFERYLDGDNHQYSQYKSSTIIRKSIDSNYYRKKYLHSSKISTWEPQDPIDHYIVIGAASGHSPVPWFNETSYLTLNPDVAQYVAEGKVISGYIHYCLTGRDLNFQHTINYSYCDSALIFMLVKITEISNRGICVIFGIINNKYVDFPENTNRQCSEVQENSAAEYLFINFKALIGYLKKITFPHSGLVAIIVKGGSYLGKVNLQKLEIENLKHPDILLIDGEFTHVTAVLPDGKINNSSIAKLLERTTMIAFKVDAVTND